MTSPRKRKAANKLAASIQQGFPSGLAQPALRALAGAGYESLDQLTRVKESDLFELHGMGPNAMRILREALHARGKSFRI
ncbi:MAG: DNA-binding protein [Planctomycetia bacterium]|nr:DNA-binding protein [Planctomycetia bacterium]